MARNGFLPAQASVRKREEDKEEDGEDGEARSMEEEARRKKQEERKQEEKKQGEGKTEEERKQSERSSSNGLLSVSFLSFASPLFDDVMISHSNTRTGDLWAAFSAASGEDIGALMNDWVDDVITRNNYVIYNKFV